MAISAVRNFSDLRFFFCRAKKSAAERGNQMFGSKLELLVVRGVESGRRFSVVVGGSCLGRSGACEIPINDPLLSRQHCLFDYVHGELRLTDLASTNGTFVNGVELSAKSIVLHLHDLITLGESTDLVVLTARAAKRYLRRRRPLPSL